MATQNIFSRCATIYQLEDNYEMMMSPENLYCDGEISQSEAERKARNIEADYRARLTEILHSN